MARKPKPEAKFRMELNGHRLAGEKCLGTWTFRCDDFPELAARFSGGEYLTGVVYEFTVKAMAGRVTILAGPAGKES